MKDEKTPHLNLPLPSGENTLDQDLPRLRASFAALDANAASQDSTLEDRRQETAVLAGRTQTLEGRATALENRTLGLAADLDTLTANAASGIGGNADAIRAETEARSAAIQAEAEARALAQTVHNTDAAAHDALVRRITVGDLSPIIGICQVESGGGAGLWFNVDAEGQPISPTKRYFDYHPVYANFKRVLMDGQIMVENQPFYTKTITPAAGPFAGKPCRIISPGQADGFKLHPAFLKNGQPLEKMFIAAYQGTNEGGTPLKAGSRPGKSPIVNYSFPTMKTYCENRNTAGVEGFMLWDIYQLSALQQLFLTEYATPDAQAMLGMGHVSGSGAVATDHVYQPTWRGYVGLWGNVWQMVDGLDADTARKIRLWKNDGSRTWVNTGFAAPAYDGTNPAYGITLKSGQDAGYDFDDIFLPATSSTSAAAGSLPDYYYGPSGSAGNVAYHGGNWGDGSGAGLFCLNLIIAASYASTNIGCRLAKV